MEEHTILEYGSKAISVQTIASGNFDLIMLRALGTIPFGLYASSAKFDFKLSGTLGKRINDLIPNLIINKNEKIIHFLGLWR